jgi:hypothetical protein
MPPMRLKEMNEVEKKISKCLKNMVAAFMACTLAFMPIALADGGKIASPEYATISASVPEFDVNEMIATFYGEQASELKLKTEVFDVGGMKIELTTGALPENEHSFSFDGCSINMVRDHKIPLKYRSDGEGMYLPPPSKIEGKYTQEEAIELARSFVQDKLGIAKEGLAVWRVDPEDASKERSRAYDIMFTYAWEGIPVSGYTEQLPSLSPFMRVGVTDEGVIVFQGCIMKVSGAGKSNAEILPSEQLKSMQPDEFVYMDDTSIELCYKLGPTFDGRLAWGKLYSDETVTTIHDMYDAYTGEKLT